MRRVLINGAEGKMGKMIASIIEADSSLNMLVLKRDSAAEPQGPFDLVIDFSLPQGAAEGFALAKKHKAAFLCGTTNLDSEFINKMRAETQIPVFYSANVSIGVFMFKELIKKAAAFYPGYILQMHEVHHAQKKDAPSGTAKVLAAAVDFPLEKITYERTGSVPGTHSLTLLSKDGTEKITVTHEALDRQLFAQSAVKIAAWLLKQKPGFYDMSGFTGELK